MMRDNVFSEDVKVPEIVENKADRAFLAIRTEEYERMGRAVKMNQCKEKTSKTRKMPVRILAAAAACALIVTASGTLTGSLKGILGRFSRMDTSGKGTENALVSAINELDKMFTLQVKAAGAGEGQTVLLTEGKPVPVMIRKDGADSWVFCGDDAEGIVNYCIGLPQITCEGDQIQSVTYDINKGAFQIVQPENEKSIITDGQLFDGAINPGSIGGDYNEERGGEPSRPFETVLYKSFSLDYSRQSDEHTWMNICNERSDSQEILRLIWNEEDSVEKYNSGVQKMLDGTVITCTVHYADGTSQSAKIKVGSQIMTRREAGEQLDPGMDPKELEEKTTVITFEQQ